MTMIDFTRKHLPLLFVLSVGVLAGCQETPEERLLGQWKSISKASEQRRGEERPAQSAPMVNLAFFDDDTCTFQFNEPVPFTGRIPTLSCDWILSGENLLKLEIRMPDGDTLVETFTVGFKDEHLELEESNGTSTTFEYVPGSG